MRKQLAIVLVASATVSLVFSPGWLLGQDDPTPSIPDDSAQQAKPIAPAKPKSSPPKAKAKATKKAAPKKSIPKFLTILVPDDTYRPVVGDRVFLWSTGKYVPVAEKLSSYDDLIQALVAGDEKGIEELAKRKTIGLEDSTTPVLVLDYKDYYKPPAYEIRILNGANKDKKAYVPEQFVKLLVPTQVRNPAYWKR